MLIFGWKDRRRYLPNASKGSVLPRHHKETEDLDTVPGQHCTRPSSGQPPRRPGLGQPFCGGKQKAPGAKEPAGPRHSQRCLRPPSPLSRPRTTQWRLWDCNSGPLVTKAHSISSKIHQSLEHVIKNCISGQCRLGPVLRRNTF